MAKKLLAQGAEAKVYVSNDVVIKERVSKSYRHPTLDAQLRKSRGKREAKLLTKAAKAGVHVPKVLRSDAFTLEVEFIDGYKVSEKLNEQSLSKQKSILMKAGIQVALLHDNNLIHGDLTTSNMVFTGKKLFLIDFGLGFVSRRIEDKAVDIHLIKQALNAKHFENYEVLFDSFLKGYKPFDREKVLERLAAVERRGRYRH